MVDNIINEDADKNNAHEQNDVTSSSSIGTISSDQINKQSSLEPNKVELGSIQTLLPSNVPLGAAAVLFNSFSVHVAPFQYFIPVLPLPVFQSKTMPLAFHPSS